MAEGDHFQSDFSKAMDCSVCMERLQNPKVLSCHHSFCKNCLDSMIRFRPDGSGVIICPMRCEEVTVVAADKTTNNLTVPYQLKSILDAFNKQSVRHESLSKKLRCSGNDQCTKDATQYCLPCKILLCQSCQHDHHDDKHNTTSYCSVTFDRQTVQTKIVCDKHDTIANFYCCDQIICLYCKERDHTLHRVETMREQTDKIKEVLLHPEYGVGVIEDIIENTFKNAGATELSISVLQSMLQKTLTDRKLRCLFEYLKNLKNEEKRLMEEFNSIVNKQMQLYPKVKSTDFYKGILQKDDFEIVFDKEKIVHNVSAFTKSIPTLRIGLTDATSSQPLGNIKVESDAYVAINDRRTPASISFSGSGTKNVIYTPLEKLKRLLDEVLPKSDELLFDRQPWQELPHKKAAPIVDNEDVQMEQAPQQTCVSVVEIDTPGIPPSRPLNHTNVPTIGIPSPGIPTSRPLNHTNVPTIGIPSPDIPTSRPLNHANVPTIGILSPAERMRRKLQQSNNAKLDHATPGVQLKQRQTSVSEADMVASGSSPSSYSTEILESVISEVNNRGIDYIRDLCKNKDEELILTILELCPSVISMKNLMGNTPLHVAALNGCVQVLSRLLSMNRDAIDTVNKLGSTPLHYAIENRHIGCVQVLLFWNCDVNIANCAGYTPTGIAELYQYVEILALIRQASKN